MSLRLENVLFKSDQIIKHKITTRNLRVSQGIKSGILTLEFFQAYEPVEELNRQGKLVFLISLLTFISR